MYWINFHHEKKSFHNPDPLYRALFRNKPHSTHFPRNWTYIRLSDLFPWHKAIPIQWLLLREGPHNCHHNNLLPDFPEETSATTHILKYSTKEDRLYHKHPHFAHQLRPNRSPKSRKIYRQYNSLQRNEDYYTVPDMSDHKNYDDYTQTRNYKRLFPNLFRY